MTRPVSSQEQQRPWPSHRRSTAWLLALFAILVCARMPAIVLQGRFWAEEGKYFFVDGWTLPATAALLSTVGGYLNLVANAATLAAARLMPLALAPYLTIGVALAFQLLPPLLLLTATDDWLRPLRIRIAGTLLLLLVPASEEIWLQTLHCQFEVTLCCAMILSFRTVGGLGAAGRLAILLLAPLCGPGAIALLPLLALRLATDRSARRLMQLLALGLGSAIQLLLFMSHASTRSYTLDPSILLSILTVRHLALPLLGRTVAERLADGFRATLHAGRLPILDGLPVVVFGVAGLAAVLRAPLRPALWPLASGLLIGLASYFGAIGSPYEMIGTYGGQRYAFVPQALFGLALLAFAATASGWARHVLQALVVWVILVGGVAFVRPWPMVADGPAWRPEVAAWHADPSHKLRIWPNGWTITLPPR